MLLYDAELDLLAIAQFLVHFVTDLNIKQT